MTPLREWFMKRIHQQPDGHWVWLGVRQNGYGKVGSRLAHRISYEMFRGRIPDDLHVLHSCNVPFCVNPEHLYLGTRVQNMQDARECGNMPTTMTSDLIKEIFTMFYKQNLSKKEACRLTGIPESTLQSAWKNPKWEAIRREVILS